MKKTGYFTFLFLTIFCFQIRSQVTPEKDGDLFYFNFANVYFEVDASEGARISSFKVDGTEILNTTKTTDYTWGSTFWPSPQNEWSAWAIWNTWPPPATIDISPYSGGISGSSISLLSDIDPGPEIQVRKTFEASLEDTSITITYTLINTKSSSQNYACWENTRVLTGGISFFPIGPGGKSGDMSSKYEEKDDSIVWYEYSSSDEGKINADGKDGWRAHVNKEIMFIKQTNDIGNSEIAPDEGEVEEYIASDFHEIENQGSYETIASGDSITYTVKWYGRKVPEDIIIEVGSSSLLYYALYRKSPPQGIGDAQSYSSIRCYPNPVFDEINIKWENSYKAKISIFSLSGTLVYQETAKNGYSKINLADKLAKGAYFINIETNHDKLIKKLIIK
jgi:hypothetical protein